MNKSLIEKRTKGRDVSIVGCGHDAEVFYLRLLMEGQWDIVSKVYDNYRSGKFHGKEIYSLELINGIKKQLLLITSAKYYNEIAIQLTSYGFSEFEDFFGVDSFDKKLVLFNANCYTKPLANYLRSNRSFNDEYSIVYETPVHLEPMPNRMEALRRCDICLTQDIRDDNDYGEEYSLGFLQKTIRRSTTLVVIPNLVGFGRAYYVQCSVDDGKQKKRDLDSLFSTKLFPYPDIVINNMIEQGLDFHHIVRAISNGNIFSRNEILSNYNSICNKFLKREEKWDIKIFDYLFNIENDSKTMYDLYHPSGEILREIARRILGFIGVEESCVQGDCELDSFDIPLYPDVRIALGLNWSRRVKQTLLYKGMGELDDVDYWNTYANYYSAQIL